MIKEIYVLYNGKRCRQCGVGLWEMLFRGYSRKKQEGASKLPHLSYNFSFIAWRDGRTIHAASHIQSAKCERLEVMSRSTKLGIFIKRFMKLLIKAFMVN